MLKTRPLLDLGVIDVIQTVLLGTNNPNPIPRINKLRTIPKMSLEKNIRKKPTPEDRKEAEKIVIKSK
jgi:hypothetical protein